MSIEDEEPPIADDEDDEDQVPNAADRKSHKRIRDRAKREAAEELAIWKAVFSTPGGRRAMWAVLNSAHAFDERFANGPNGFPQPEATWLHAGEQRMGFRLFLSWLRLDPEGVISMMREHHTQLRPPEKRRRRKEES